ncbi:MAG: hypothetical protein ACK4HW_07410 [Roseinatronobacter sp.]
MSLTHLRAFGAALALLITPAFAQTGAQGIFSVHNDTQGSVVVGFYVSDDLDSFSDNWLEDPIMPGEAFEAQFFADSGACINYFVIGWLGADLNSEVLDDPVEIDICQATNVYLEENGISFD